jgi:DNA-binding IclR family transcriptional regulator
MNLCELLGLGDEGLSLTQISERLAIPKSSLSQLLANLLRRKWVFYDHSTKLYSIGPMVARIAHASEQTPTLSEIVHAVLKQLSADTGETSAFNQLVGDEAETTATVLAKATLLAFLRKGQRSSLYSTSYGKVMLAHFSTEALSDYLARTELMPRTPRTIRSAEELKLQLESIRRDGFGYSFEEHSRGVVGSAKAVLLPSGQCSGVLSVAAAAGRYDGSARQLINAALQRAVHEVLRALNDGATPTRLQPAVSSR